MLSIVGSPLREDKAERLYLFLLFFIYLFIYFFGYDDNSWKALPIRIKFSHMTFD